MENIQKLQNIFIDIFDDEDIVLTKGMTSEDIEDWDSLAQINLIVAIEEEFNISFDLEEISNLPNVGAMLDLIGSKLGE